MLNKQGNGKIDWTDYTWNPISGCLHNCSYCYLKRIDKRFGSEIMKPKFHSTRLNDISRSKKLKEGDKIFVGSSGDMFGGWVADDDIVCVLQKVDDNPEYIFQFLTKHPSRYFKFELPENGWYGTTIDGTKNTLKNIDLLFSSVPNNLTKFISFEPLLAPVNTNIEDIDWIIIGADSSQGAKKPEMEWAKDLIIKARYLNIPVWIKDNFNYPKTIKELPF